MIRRTFLIKTTNHPPKVNAYVRCHHGVWIVRAIARQVTEQKYVAYVGNMDISPGYYVNLEAINDHRIPVGEEVREIPIPREEVSLSTLMKAMNEWNDSLPEDDPSIKHYA